MAASLDRETALKRIAEILTTDQRATFLIGAGCSVNAGIPTASAMVAELRRTYPEHCIGIAHQAANVYGQIMACLTRGQRRDYIRKKIDAAKLNWGHIALGQLMASGYVTRVLSVNFDPLLARANGLIGHYPAIYDFGAAPSDSVKMIAEPCIIHLHGQSTGFVLYNTVEETAEHVAKLKRVIADSVDDRPVIIIGYSGGSDGVMEALGAAYNGDAALYWIGHEGAPTAGISKLLQVSPHAHYAIGGDADRFLVDLAREVERRKPTQEWPPKVFSDPVQHLLDEVEPVGEMPMTDKATETENYLAGWRADMTTLRIYHAQQFVLSRKVETLRMQGDVAALRDLAATEQTLDRTDGKATKAMSRDQYWSHIKSGAEFGMKGITKGRATSIQLLQKACDEFSAATKIDNEPSVAYFNWGVALGQLASQANSVEKERLLTEAISKYESVLAIKPNDTQSLHNWGLELSRLARLKSGEKRRLLLVAAKEKFEIALKLAPNTHIAIVALGNSLVDLSVFADSEEKSRLYAEAQSLYQIAEILVPGEARYNLACLAALRYETDMCKRQLVGSFLAGNLPSRPHLDADRDLENVRSLPWFEEIRQLAQAE